MSKRKKFNQEIFHQRFKQACKEKGMNQLGLAALTGINQASISRFLGGYSTPRVPILFNIANGLGVSADWLLGLKDKKR
jgi:transcriptional regulator with XRE-family HTH domain